MIFEPVVGNMGCVVPTPSFLRALARLTTQARRAADLRRSDDRLSRGLRRRAIAVRHRARPDDAGQDRRRRLAGRRLRRPGRDHGPRSARRARCFRPARSAAIRWPRPPASPRSSVLRDEPPYARLEQLGARLAAGLSRRPTGGRHSALRGPRRQHDDAVLQLPSR